MAGILDRIGGLFGQKKKREDIPMMAKRQPRPDLQPVAPMGIQERVQQGPYNVQTAQPSVRQWRAPLEAGVDSGAGIQGAAYNTGGWPNARLQGNYGRAVQPVYGSEDEPTTMYLEDMYY